MSRLISVKQRIMLDYRTGDICPMCSKPMSGAHAGWEDIALINGTWRMVHRSHKAGIFPRPVEDPKTWPTW